MVIAPDNTVQTRHAALTKALRRFEAERENLAGRGFDTPGLDKNIAALQASLMRVSQERRPG